MPNLEMGDSSNLNFLTESSFGEFKSAQSSTNTSFKAPQSDDDSINMILDNERWTTSSNDDVISQQNSVDKVRELEEEHSRLSDSILTLSSHFAQIQFRLQQITMASSDKKDQMLKELQEFASKPCIDLTEVKQDAEEIRQKHKNGQNDANLDEKRKNVLSLIRELKKQTDELEKFAYEQGSGELPTSELKQRHKIVFDKLHEKIKLNIELENLTEQELHKSVENGIKQLLEPIKEKEQLVDQLQTQIVDLERFVQLLQQESIESSTPKQFTEKIDTNSAVRSLQSMNRPLPKRQNSFFSFGTKKFEKNELKNTLRGNHYGDQRARLEITVDVVKQILKKYSIVNLDNDDLSTLPDEKRQQEIFEWSEVEVVNIIRKEFCPSLRELLEHGMKNEISINNSLIGNVVFGCLSNRTSRNGSNSNSKVYELNHIWDVIVYFYEDRKLKDLNDGSIGRLSQTFKLEDIHGKTMTSKEMLMYTIENIISTHKKLKRTPDAMWKAFVSAAMNEKKLPGWIRIIFRSEIVVQNCYHPWSYVAHTGCEDIRPTLESLQEYHVDLPVDLAIRPFEHIKDAF